MRLEELKEWLEQAEQNKHISEPTLSPLPPSDVLSVSMLETEPLPESPLSAVHPEACVGMEVSSISGESDTDGEEEEILPFLLHPLHDKHQRVKKDFSKLMDCYQSFKELPGMLDPTVTLKSHDSLDFGDSAPPGNTSVMDRQQHRTVNEKETTKSAQQQAAADCVPPSGPSVRSQVCDSMETHPEALCHSSVLPGQLGRERKMAGNRKTQSSSLTSLAESTEPRTMGLKAKAKTVRASPLSPETDSGFMGSESSQLTLAVLSSRGQWRVPLGCLAHT